MNIPGLTSLRGTPAALAVACAATLFILLNGCGGGGGSIALPLGGENPPDASLEPLPSNYDPLAHAYSEMAVDRAPEDFENPEAPVTSMCYTKTEGISNPCWTCHTAERGANLMGDWNLQEEYAFSEAGLTNHWKNLFADRREEIADITDDEVLSYIREDNYTALRQALRAFPEFPGYALDLDFRAGFDAEGFAADGTAWRAFRYKPFLGTFWPTNGSTDDVLIRLPEKFRRDGAGRADREFYKANLEILATALSVDPSVATSDIDWSIEPVDEELVSFDLDGDGRISGVASRIRGLPSRYLGGAADVVVSRFLYPQGVEFLHTVRYIDPDAPTLIATRMKEVRYSRKDSFYDLWALGRSYTIEFDNKFDGLLPRYGGGPDIGLSNDFGWRLQGYIEDAEGRLRLQTEEETRFCMGCHSTIGVTVDQTFAFPRKVPGADGWRHQDVRGIKDVPQATHSEPETLTYFKRVRGGDEFRANEEILDLLFPGGVLDEAAVRRAAPGGDRDLAWLIAPSRERALLLNKAYLALVREQRFHLGRDAVLAPTKNVHESIENGDTDLAPAGLVFKDGRLWLSWD